MFGKSKAVKVGNIIIGGDAPVTVQSMTNTDAHDFASTLRQVSELEQAGCDIVRLSVPDNDAAQVFAYLKNHGVKVPLVADIHFDYQLALAAVKAGADKIRINPGNIGAKWKVEEVASSCKSAGVPIRIGVNGGSLEKWLHEKYSSPDAGSSCESAFPKSMPWNLWAFPILSFQLSPRRFRIWCRRAVLFPGNPITRFISV